MTITGKEYDTCPYVKCKFCGKDFSGGATRIANHLTGNGMTECADQSELQGEVRGVGLRLRLRRERRRERPEGLSARIARQGGIAALIAATAAPPDAIIITVPPMYLYSYMYSCMYSVSAENTVLYTVFSAYPHVFPT